MARFLFGIPPFWGHLAPTVALAQRLLERGHEVAYASHPVVREPLARAGLDLLDAYRWGDRMLEGAELLGQGLKEHQVFFRIGNAYLHGLPEGVEGFRRLLGSWKPDVVLHDILLHAGALAAEAEGVPRATSCPLILPHWLSPDLPAYGPGLPLARGRTFRGRLGRGLSRLVRGFPCRRLNRLRRSLGLPPRPEPWLDVSEQLTLCYSTEAFEYPRPGLHPAIHYIGPSIGEARGDHGIDFPWTWLDGSPLVCLSLGTVFNGFRPFFDAAAKASEGQPWQLVMKVGPRLPAGAWPGGPPNVLAVHEQPQLALLKRASAFVSHAGDNSVHEALAEGVPLVVAPAGADQVEVAQRVVACGAGLRVDLHRVGPLELRRCIQEVLGTPSYREAAARVAADFRRCDGPGIGAELLERLALTRRPVLRPEPGTLTRYARPAWGDGPG
ncbi:MAG: glycosyltransferase [Holophagaceae bacterium]